MGRKGGVEILLDLWSFRSFAGRARLYRIVRSVGGLCGGIARNRLSVAGLFVVTVVGIAALRPVWFVSSDPDEIRPEIRLRAPSWNHPFGTDEMGRDLFSRVVHGASLSFTSGLMVVLIASSAGCILGAIASQARGPLGELIMRTGDMFLAFPPLVMAMAIAAALEGGIWNAMLALSVVWWPQYARLMYAQAIVIQESPFLEAARCLGAGDLRLLLRHTFPNCVPPILVKATLDVGYAILQTAALSFIGLGARPPSSEWGALIVAGRSYLLDAWWYPTFPGLAIFSVVLGFNLFGDGLREILDPRLQSRAQQIDMKY